MIQIHPKNGTPQMAETNAEVNATRKEKCNTESRMDERNQGGNDNVFVTISDIYQMIRCI